MALRRAFAVFLLLAACGDDRPPAEDTTTLSAPASTEEADEDVAAEPATTTKTTTTTVRPVCVAGETRECKIFWTAVDQPGIQHCRLTRQACRDDGSDWRPCGE